MTTATTGAPSDVRAGQLVRADLRHAGDQRRAGRARQARTSIRLALTCLLSEGHLLLEDFPGTGKTSLAKAIANSVQGTHSRIQFTPDLLPSDVTGVTIYDQRSGAVRVPPRADLRDHRARRRDQPGLAEDPVGAARGDGGGPGHGRRHAAPGRPAVHGHRHPEPDRAGRHLPAAGGAARPVPDEDQPRLPRPRLDRRAARGRGHQGPVGRRAERDHHQRDHRRCPQLADRCTSTRPSSATSASSRTSPASSATSGSGCSVRGCLAFVRAAKTWALADGRGYVVPDDIKELAVPRAQPPAAARRRGRVLRRHRRGRDRPAPVPGPPADQRGACDAPASTSPTGLARPCPRRARVSQLPVPPRPTRLAGHHARRRRCCRGACLAARRPARLAGAVPRAPPAACIALLIAVGFVIGRPSLDISIELDPARVSVGDARGRPARRSPTGRGRGCVPLSVEVPVGHGRATLPAAVAGQRTPATTSCSWCRPTAARSSRSARRARSAPTRSACCAGTPSSRRPSSCSCTRRSSASTSLSPGLQRDLEGQATRDLSTSDLAFHTLRDYVTGDDWRHVHWRSHRQDRQAARPPVPGHPPHPADRRRGRGARRATAPRTSSSWR